MKGRILSSKNVIICSLLPVVIQKEYIIESKKYENIYCRNKKKGRRLGSLTYVQIVVCGNVIVLTTSVNDYSNKQEMLNSHFIRANINICLENYFKSTFSKKGTMINRHQIIMHVISITYLVRVFSIWH